MTASQRVQILTTKADEISVLREFLVNPNYASQLEAEVKRLNALTEEEEARLHESRILMQQRDTMAREMEGKQAQMAAEKAAHEKHIADKTQEFETWSGIEKAKIEEANKALDERKTLAEAEDTRLRQYEYGLKEKAAKMQGLFGA